MNEWVNDVNISCAAARSSSPGEPSRLSPKIEAVIVKLLDYQLSKPGVGVPHHFLLHGSSLKM